jgi:hypothetical protein
MEITFFANIPNDPSNKKCPEPMLANERMALIFDLTDQFGLIRSNK